MNRFFLFTAIALLTVSCSGGAPAQTVQEDSKQVALASEQRIGNNTIDISSLGSVGKILSRKIVPIYSLVEGVVTDFDLLEGQKVNRDRVLLRIDATEMEMQIEELETALSQKRFEAENTYIGLGYSKDSIATIPADVRKNVELMTGCTYTSVQLENKKALLERYVIRAPFEGRVLNLAVNRNQFVHKGDTLFYLLDTENLMVTFEVIENQLSEYRIGMDLEFTTVAYGDKVFRARLSSIAPNVEDTGMVVMTADIVGEMDNLIPGMSVIVNFAQ